MSQVNVELGLSSTAQVSLNDSAVRNLFVKPTGQISLDDGHGKSNLNAAISDQFIDSTQGVPTVAVSGYRLNSNGNAYMRQQAVYTAIAGEWLLTGVNSDFEARATVTSGTLTSGVTGTWISLTTTTEWSISRGPTGIKTTDFDVEIRRVIDSVVVDTAHISLYAESS